MDHFSEPRRLVFRGKPSQMYYVRVSRDGKRTWRSTKQKTRRGALEVLKHWRSSTATEEYGSVEVRLEEFIDRWYATREARVSSSCAAVYRAYVAAWKRILPLGKRLRALSGADLERYLATRKEERLSPRSLNNELSTLRQLFSYAQREGLITRNPAATCDAFPEPERAIRTIDDDGEARLLNAARQGGERHYGFILTLCRSGLRRGSVAKLDWRDIDFSRGEWRIPAVKMKSRKDFTAGRPIDDDLLEWLCAQRQPAGLIFEPLEIAIFLSDHRDVGVVLKSYRAVETTDAREAMKNLLRRVGTLDSTAGGEQNGATATEN